MFCYLLLDFQVKTVTRIFLPDKRLFEISKVEITRVDCTFISLFLSGNNKKVSTFFGAFFCSPGEKVLEELLHYPWHRHWLYIKVFKTSYFPNHMIDLVYIWYGNRYRFKVLFSNTRNHAYDLKFKVRNLELLC